MRDFVPGVCSRGTLREQSYSVCTNDFMGILHSREQNFHPAKCSTIFNRLNIWEQTPGANWANLKTLPRVYWNGQNEPGAEHAPGAKPLVFIGLKTLLNSPFVPWIRSLFRHCGVVGLCVTWTTENNFLMLFCPIFFIFSFPFSIHWTLRLKIQRGFARKCQ